MRFFVLVLAGLLFFVFQSSSVFAATCQTYGGQTIHDNYTNATIDVSWQDCVLFNKTITFPLTIDFAEGINRSNMTMLFHNGSATTITAQSFALDPYAANWALPVTNSSLNLSSSTIVLVTLSASGATNEFVNLTINYSNGTKQGLFNVTFLLAFNDSLPLTFQTKDYNNAALGSVLVTLYYENGTVAATNTSTGAGLATFSVPANSYYYTATKALHYNKTQTAANALITLTNKSFTALLRPFDTAVPEVIVNSTMFPLLAARAIFDTATPYFNFSATDAIDTSLRCEVRVNYVNNSLYAYRNLTGVNGNAVTNTISIAADGTYEFMPVCFDDANNSNSLIYLNTAKTLTDSDGVTFKVDTTAPQFTSLRYTANSVKNNTYVTFTINVSDTHLNTSSVNASVDGMPAKLVSFANNSFTFRFHVNSTVFNTSLGTHAVSVYANDTRYYVGELLLNHENSTTFAQNFTHDFVRPTITSIKFNATTFVNATTGVARAASIAIKFSEYMSLVTVTLSDGAATYAFNKSFDNATNTTTIDPYLLLPYNKTLFLTISSSSRDNASNTLTSATTVNFTTVPRDTDGDTIFDSVDPDDDNDGINDTDDFVLGNGTHIMSNVQNLFLTINGSTNLSRNITGFQHVSISNNISFQINFTYNFSSLSTLDLGNITIMNDTRGYLIHGLAGIRKNISMDTSLPSTEGVCVHASGTDPDFSYVSAACTDSDELWVPCGGSTVIGAYTCANTSGTRTVRNVSSSILVFMNKTVPPRLYGHQVLESSAIRSGYSVTVGQTSVQIRFNTYEVATCYFSKENNTRNWSQMASHTDLFTATNAGKTHTASVTTNTTSGSFTYVYVACRDAYGNVHAPPFAYGDANSSRFYNVFKIKYLVSGGSSSTAASEETVSGGLGSVSEFVTRTFTWIGALANVPLLAETDATGLAFVSYSFTPLIDTTRMQLQAKQYLGEPNTLLGGYQVFAYLLLDFYPLDETEMSGGILTFRVNKSSFSSRNLGLDALSLFKYEDSAWTSLPISYTRGDNTYFYFTASTKFFGLYAIALPALPVAQTSVTPLANDSDPNATIVFAPLDNESNFTGGFAYTLPEDSSFGGFSFTKFSFGFLAFLALLVLSLIGFYVYQTKLVDFGVKQDDHILRFDDIIEELGSEESDALKRQKKK